MTRDDTVSRRCACPGCDRDALADGAYCPSCEEEPHVGHCPRCHRVLFDLQAPACPACGASLASPGPNPERDQA
jgi:hypothetical protein